jgi:cytochrome c oxidase assembly factor CtaG
VNTWNNIAWFPLCVGLSGVGLVLSWLTWRRRGVRRGIRAAAWSLLPLALYLTGSILLVGRIGSAVVNFAQSFVFSPKTWSGVVLFVVAAVIFLVSGGIPLLSSARKRAKKRELKRAGSATEVTTAGGAVAVSAGRGDPASAPAKTVTAPTPAAKRGKGAAADDDGLDADVADILRRRGIR